ncbi:uncharacterized protein MELLADRAFT_101590 [Melampsora larici-populina 98AG31]|uniref:Tet-like 2OG-Fe(II) oxygenase domain-containing protein n=1 Tax=Melampsora larici-populina (strain 98AG31 / pathotype 3-4-7) TaxID=747676 RepID=F4R6C1_MELLP|nr:uncharacterized protein MELLADRAFT_101590 [Melampsora larici-populina 98AG31]EGG11852.1 hypothetical protein MELLADRAFT_101590 [Melampsora larici-populina 98AG31]
MYAAGFRPGFDPLVKAAAYAFNATTSGQLWRMQDDLTRQGNLPAIEDFFAERFANLSSYAFESNAEIASRTGAPSWAGQSFYINQTLVDRINQVNDMRGNMNDEEWNVFRGTLLTGYPEEARKKMARLAAKHGINDLSLLFVP